MKNLTNFLILFLISNYAIAQDNSFDIKKIYPIETSHSYLQFIATYMGYAEVKGNFADFYGSIYYDPADLSQTSVSFQIDTKSIDTNNDWRDRDLRSANWFEAETYPHIKFSSTGINEGEDGFSIIGDLTIKAETKQVEIPMQPVIGVIRDIRGDDQVIFKGSYTLNRKEYGVMGKNWSQIKEGIAALSDEITIEFSILGKRINESNLSNFLRNKEKGHGKLYASYQNGGIPDLKDEAMLMAKDSLLDAQHLNIVGYMLMKQDKTQDALEVFLVNKKYFPDNAQVYNALGGIYYLLGEKNKAVENYTTALDLDTNSINAQEVLKHIKKP